MNNDPILTFAFVCIAIILGFLRFALPIMGIICSIIWIKKNKTNKKIVPFGLFFFFGMWLLYSIGKFIYNYFFIFWINVT